MTMEVLTMANNRENREVAAFNCITLRTSRYISVYVGWSTFDTVAYRYVNLLQRCKNYKMLELKQDKHIILNNF